MKQKKAYLMIGGTLLPAIAGYLAAKSLKTSDSTRNLIVIAGLIAGGIVTSKMLK
jgi:hypothetical protein